MKRILLCLIGMAALVLRASAADPPQPFSAVFWTTTTLQSPSGKSAIFTRRIVYTRDASGNVQSQIYKPTKGSAQDTTAPLEHVSTSLTSAQAPLPTALSSTETMQVTNLGTSLFSGLLTTGTRQIFTGANGQQTRTREVWFCPILGVTVHLQSSDARGDTTVGDLSELQLGTVAAPVPVAQTALAASPAVPLLTLYRGLFTEVAHMERDRQANNLHANMIEIEDHLRKKLNLSSNEWQTLVATSVKVESYTEEKSKEARSFAEQDKAARRNNPLGPNTLAKGRATLHQMQLDLNTHVQADINELKAAVGPTATDHIQAYLQGPLSASTSVVSVRSARLQAQQTGKEQAR